MVGAVPVGDGIYRIDMKGIADHRRGLVEPRLRDGMLSVENAITTYILAGSTFALGAPCYFFSRCAGRVGTSGVDVHYGRAIRILRVGIFEKIPQVVITDRLVVSADNRVQRGAQFCSALPACIGVISCQCNTRRNLTPQCLYCKEDEQVCGKVLLHAAESALIGGASSEYGVEDGVLGDIGRAFYGSEKVCGGGLIRF